MNLHLCILVFGLLIKGCGLAKSLFSQNHLTRNENEKQIPNIKVQELLSKETFAKTTTAKILKRNKTGESVVQIRI